MTVNQQVFIIQYQYRSIFVLKNARLRLWLQFATVVTVAGVKYELLNSMGMRLELQYPAVVTVVKMKYEISDSVMVLLWAPGEELGPLCWGIRLSQSEPFHIIGQGHLLSSRSGEAFPTNATQLARSSILCLTTLLFSLYHRHLSFFPSFFLSSLFLLLLSNSLVSSALSIQYNSLLNLYFLSSSALCLPLCLFIFSVMCSYWLCIAEVCDTPLYSMLEKQPWSQYTFELNSNEFVCVCTGICVMWYRTEQEWQMKLEYWGH